MNSFLFGLDDLDPFLGFAGAEFLSRGFAPPDQFGASDDPFYSVAGSAIHGSYVQAGYDTTAASTTTLVQSSVNQAVVVSSGGITINVVYTAAAQAAPQSFKDGIQQAVAIMAAAISDKITVNITVNYSGTGGGASAGPSNGYYEPYDWVRANLINNASPGDTTFNTLPAGTSIQSKSNVAVWNAQLKLWGVLGANDTSTADGSANFATDINPNLLVGVALHELTHAMGRIPYGSSPDIFDLFRFTSPGTRLFLGGASAPPAYFSLDGGFTKLADYGQTSDASDFLNSGVQGPNDPFNEFYTSTTTQQLTAADLKQLAALGFHLTSNTSVTIEAFGSTKLLQASGNYFLAPVGGSTGPTLKINNLAVTAGMYGAAMLAIGAEVTASGYEVAWHNTNSDLYTIWYTDVNGNYLSAPSSNLSGGSATLEAYETSFHQDLNSDGVIGNALSTIEAAGSTALIKSGNNFYLGTSGPLLKIGGAAVTPSTYSGVWLPIAVEAVADGYLVAWHDSGNNFSIWKTDASGTYVANLTGIVAGSDPTLLSFEASFHQDLNNDGVIGLVGTTVESAGAISLVSSGGAYWLGTAGALKYNGAPVTATTFPGWAPIAAEATASGFQVAWGDSSGTQFSVWNTDSSGNYLANAIGIVSGNSATLQAFEISFHQDLNHDGVVGVVGTAIETAGTTSLIGSAGNYWLGAAVSLKYLGAPVTATTFPGWAPIGVETTASGFKVAWGDSSGTQFSVWNTDGSGNYLANAIGIVSGNSATLQSFEPSFFQDLNNDGVIGVSGHTAPAAATVQDAFAFKPDADPVWQTRAAALAGLDGQMFAGQAGPPTVDTNASVMLHADLFAFAGGASNLQDGAHPQDGHLSTVLADLLSGHFLIR